MANTPYGSEWQERMREIASAIGQCVLLILLFPLALGGMLWALTVLLSIALAPVWFLSWLFS